MTPSIRILLRVLHCTVSVIVCSKQGAIPIAINAALAKHFPKVYMNANLCDNNVCGLQHLV
jgi:hypothetical protein